MGTVCGCNSNLFGHITHRGNPQSTFDIETVPYRRTQHATLKAQASLYMGDKRAIRETRFFCYYLVTDAHIRTHLCYKDTEMCPKRYAHGEGAYCEQLRVPRLVVEPLLLSTNS